MPEFADLLRFAGIALIVFFLFRMQMRRERSHRKAEHREKNLVGATKSNGAGRASPTGVSRSAELLQLELQTTSRDVLAEIQTKTAILQQLILDAHQATERLEQALQREAQCERDMAV